MVSQRNKYLFSTVLNALHCYQTLFIHPNSRSARSASGRALFDHGGESLLESSDASQDPLLCQSKGPFGLTANGLFVSQVVA